jgi:hypothetical protein
MRWLKKFLSQRASWPDRLNFKTIALCRAMIFAPSAMCLEASLADFLPFRLASAPHEQPLFRFWHLADILLGDLHVRLWD